MTCKLIQSRLRIYTMYLYILGYIFVRFFTLFISFKAKIVLSGVSDVVRMFKFYKIIQEYNYHKFIKIQAYKALY